MEGKQKIKEKSDCAANGETQGFVRGDRVLVDVVFFKEDFMDYVERRYGRAALVREGMQMIPDEETKEPRNCRYDWPGVKR